MGRTGTELRRWAVIPGFAELYEVSDDGVVRSWNGGRWGRRTTPKILRQKQNEWGYMVVSMGKESKRVVHRLILEAFVGPAPAGHEAAHLDGIASANRLSNLQWKLPIANSADKQLHGTMVQGERHPQAKLTAAQVTEILACRGKKKQVEIAREYGVSQMCVSNIMRGERWKSLSGGVA